MDSFFMVMGMLATSVAVTAAIGFGGAFLFRAVDAVRTHERVRARRDALAYENGHLQAKIDELHKRLAEQTPYR